MLLELVVGRTVFQMDESRFRREHSATLESRSKKATLGSQEGGGSLTTTSAGHFCGGGRASEKRRKLFVDVVMESRFHALMTCDLANH